MNFDISWLSMLGMNVADADRIARMADLIMDVKTVRPVGAPITITQAKGRGLRGTNNGPVRFTRDFDPPDMRITYKRRHRRQTRKAFPFCVTVLWAPKLLIEEMEQWCEQWGTQGKHWDVGGQVYYFTQKSHATMFVLSFKGRDEPVR